MTAKSLYVGRSPAVLMAVALAGAALVIERPVLAQITQIYDNGGFETGPLSESGVAAPVGTQWSEAPNPFGNTNVANTLAGVSCSVTTTVWRCADDFNVPVGQTWSLSSVVVFVYQTSYAGVTSPVTAGTLRVWRGRPGDAGSVIVFGDEMTDRLVSSTDALAFRIFNSVVGVGGGPPSVPSTTRRIWRTTLGVSPALVLTAGQYWIDWNTSIAANGAHFAPPVSYRGTRDVPGLNARQFTPTGWIDSRDFGQAPTGQPAPTPVNLDFPFKLTGSVANAPLAPASRTMDFDGDNRSDFAIARSASAVGQTTFWIRHAGGTFTGVNWGSGVGFAGGDIATPADFDGDGKTDVAVWRPGTPGVFWVQQSSNGALKAQAWGIAGDDPTVVGDYDGDGKADFAVYRPGAGAGQQSIWWVLRSSDLSVMVTPWGLFGDRPYPADYDGDRRMDPAVIRNNGGLAQHYQSRSTLGFHSTSYGLFTDKFVVGDFDADGRHDLTAVRNTGGSHQWFVTRSSDGVLVSYLFGVAAVDFLTPGDFDGDGRTDTVVWRSGQPVAFTNFFLWRSFSSPGIQLWGMSAGALTPPDLPLGTFNVR